MSLIVLDNITKNYADKDVLRGVSGVLAPDERVGLVGSNGCGKTTLLRIIAGEEQPTDGQCRLAAGLRCGYLPQEPPAPLEVTLRQSLESVFDPIRRMEAELHELSEAMQRGHDEATLRRFGRLQQHYEAAGGYAWHDRIPRVLEGLGFGEDLWQRPLALLSGGQRTRGYLARLLLQRPDVLLLDEPTNHLDLESVEWLEGWLADFKGSLIVISHDRYFLDRTTTVTWELSFGQLESYRGGYSEYVPKRQQRYEQRLKQWQAENQYVAKTQEYVRRYGAGQRAVQARGRMKRLQRFVANDAIDRPMQERSISISLSAAGRAGDIVLELADLNIGFEHPAPLLSVERLQVLRGERIAIVGSNGCGKTTLLRTLLGELRPLGGKVHRGANVRVGYLSQTHHELQPDWTAMQAVMQADPSAGEQRCRDLLGGLLLSGDEARRTIRELSGGQRSRVVLARLVLQKANVLVLDEPSNHLDIPSQEVLQEVLDDFDGTIVFVSHDRYLIDALATTIWASFDRQIKPLSGGWEKFLAWRTAQRAQQTQAAELAAAVEGGKPAEQSKLDKAEDYRRRRQQANRLQRVQKRLTEVEGDIHRLEAALRTLSEQVNAASAAGKLDDVARLGSDYAETDVQLQELMEQWEQLGLELEADE